MQQPRALIRVPMADILARAIERPPGYVQDVLSHGQEVGDAVELDLAAWHKLREKYGPTKEPSISPPSPGPAPPALLAPGGVGTLLHGYLGRLGLHATPNCQCIARLQQMDAMGPDWCESNLGTIVGWLEEEARKRGLPFSRMAAGLLVRHAIRRHRRTLRHGAR